MEFGCGLSAVRDCEAHHLGHIRDEDAEMAEISKRAFQGILDGLKPGVRARDVYDAWQSVVDATGIPEYRRHHCG